MQTYIHIIYTYIYVRVARGDTQLPGESPTGSFDLILGSEILYLKDQHLNLLRTIKAFSSPTTCTYLLYKHRNLGEIDFIPLAREAGFKVKKVFAYAHIKKLLLRTTW